MVKTLATLQGLAAARTIIGCQTGDQLGYLGTKFPSLNLDPAVNRRPSHTVVKHGHALNTFTIQRLTVYCAQMLWIVC